MSQKTQQGLGPGLGPTLGEGSESPRVEEAASGDRITPVDSERGRELARFAEAAAQAAQAFSGRPASEDSGDRKSDPERSQFDTIPGGGLNRESGGRAAARVYVSPKTPVHPQGGHQATVSVDLDPEVSQDARSFRTERALRVGSVAPPSLSNPPPPSAPKGWLSPTLIALTTAAVLTAAIVVFGSPFKKMAGKQETPNSAVLVGPATPVPPVPEGVRAMAPASRPDSPRMEVPAAASASANPAENGPMTTAASSASAKIEPTPSKVRPDSTARPTQQKKSTAPSSSSTKPSGPGDVWLE